MAGKVTTGNHRKKSERGGTKRQKGPALGMEEGLSFDIDIYTGVCPSPPNGASVERLGLTESGRKQLLNMKSVVLIRMVCALGGRPRAKPHHIRERRRRDDGTRYPCERQGNGVPDILGGSDLSGFNEGVA